MQEEFLTSVAQIKKKLRLDMDSASVRPTLPVSGSRQLEKAPLIDRDHKRLVQTEVTVMRHVDAVSRSSGSQILVFHFPGVIKRVKRGVPN